MALKVNFSKRNKERFYLPGQEIRISRGIVSQRNYTTESDNVLTCKNRTIFALICFAAIYCVLALRVTYVCLSGGINIDTAIAGDNLGNREFIRLKNPVKRADILDRNGEIIATSLPTVNLHANTKKIKNPKEVAEKLSYIFPEIPYERLVALLSRKSTFTYIKRGLSPAQQSQVNALGIPEFEFENCETRIYPHNNLFSHVLGKTDIDNIGIVGLEKYMNERLTTSTKPLQVSLDLGIQNTIREELEAGVKQFSADGAAAILMDVNSGQVLSLVSLPDFNPNENLKPDDSSMFNFATKGVYEAGSVFKVFNTALCLESGKIDINDKFDTTKAIYFGRHKISDPHGSHSWLTPEDILVESSNVGSVQEILRVGKKYQRHFLQEINLDKELNEFELAEKARPLFNSEKRWNDDMMATISYGYSVSATPLHIITAFSAVVNGGIYRQPTLLYEPARREEKRIVSVDTSEKMRSLLRAVVVRGTGRRSNVEGYEVMGKTGTADKLLPTGGYDHKKSMSTFLSGFPASNPQYALLVVMDNPKGSKETYGHTEAGWNAVPISKNIISAIAPQLNVKADFDLEKQKSIVDAAYKRK